MTAHWEHVPLVDEIVRKVDIDNAMTSSDALVVGDKLQVDITRVFKHGSTYKCCRLFFLVAVLDEKRKTCVSLAFAHLTTLQSFKDLIKRNQERKQ